MNKHDATIYLKGVKDFYGLDKDSEEAIDMAIEALSAEKTGWIPVSERLPEVGQDVIFCDGRWTEEGCLRADGDWWQFRWSMVKEKEEVIAWMPLPEPYKGGDTE